MKKTRIQTHTFSCQPTNLFFERWVGIKLPTLWLLDNHTRPPQRKTYKLMIKTQIQTNIQMYYKNMHTNTHTKCMTKTCLQKYGKNTHTNVWKKQAYKHAYKCMKKHAYKHAYKWACRFVCFLDFQGSVLTMLSSALKMILVYMQIHFSTDY